MLLVASAETVDSRADCEGWLCDTVVEVVVVVAVEVGVAAWEEAIPLSSQEKKTSKVLSETGILPL